MDTDYDKEFYDNITDGAERSAKVMVPGYMSMLTVDSVVDIGCGRGVWGREFMRNGCRDVLGVDGPYVTDPVIPFMAHDLREPLVLDKEYDLAVCLEVAEHLPEEYADVLVQSLSDASDTILFGAAIPYQTGHGHVNCQWPSYWAEKFHQHGYAVDDFRYKYWTDPRIEPWYIQNTLLYIRGPELIEDFGTLDVVHPTIHGWGR